MYNSNFIIRVNSLRYSMYFPQFKFKSIRYISHPLAQYELILEKDGRKKRLKCSTIHYGLNSMNQKLILSFFHVMEDKKISLSVLNFKNYVIIQMIKTLKNTNFLLLLFFHLTRILLVLNNVNWSLKKLV